jgi:hypothetical protein
MLPHTPGTPGRIYTFTVYSYKQVVKDIRFFIEYETLHYHQP